jgi:hypothetical protein
MITSDPDWGRVIQKLLPAAVPDSELLEPLLAQAQNNNTILIVEIILIIE